MDRSKRRDLALAEYTPEVIEHFQNPRNPGPLPDATGTGQAGDGANGELLIQIHIRTDGETIAEARFRAFGCSASIAAASVATELLTGRTLRSAVMLDAAEITDVLHGLPADKQHCAEYAAAAARAAVHDHLNHSETA